MCLESIVGGKLDLYYKCNTITRFTQTLDLMATLETWMTYTIADALSTLNNNHEWHIILLTDKQMKKQKQVLQSRLQSNCTHVEETVVEAAKADEVRLLPS